MPFPESPVMNGVDKVDSYLVLQVEVSVIFTFTKDGEHILETGERVCVSGAK